MAALSLSGCGTLFSRIPAPPDELGVEPQTGSGIGFPLFDGLRLDVDMFRRDSGRLTILYPVIALSMPVDLAFDLALLPADLIAGWCGWRRPEPYWRAQLRK